MALTVPGTRTVTVLRQVRKRDDQDPTKWARDGRGNAVYVFERIDIPNCSVQPTQSTEDNGDGRVLVTTTTTIYAPLSWPGGPIDAVEIDGERWQVQGKPRRWEHPRLGHVEVTVTEVDG